METKSSGLPLQGCRILLIFQNNIRYSIRLRQNVQALLDAGAQISLITQEKENLKNEIFSDIEVVKSWEFPLEIVASNNSVRFIRIISNIIRGLFRRLFQYRVNTVLGSALQHRLKKVIKDYDIFWAIDAVSLPSVVTAARGSNVPIVYETLDLVPEYQDLPGLSRSRKKHEEKLINEVTAFITAGEEYANYYMEKYANRGLSRRPLVRENSHNSFFEAINPTRRPYDFIFFGNLAPDRPIRTMIEAFAKANNDSRLTIKGKNFLGSYPFELINELNLEDRVLLEDPCNPEEGVSVAHNYDIGIAMLNGENENERRAPTAKLCTYLAAGLAIMSSDLPGMRTQIGLADAFFVEDNSAKGWEDAFGKMSEMTPSAIDAMKHSSLMRSREIDLRPQIEKYINLFAKVYADVQIKKR